MHESGCNSFRTRLTACAQLPLRGAQIGVILGSLLMGYMQPMLYGVATVASIASI